MKDNFTFPLNINCKNGFKLTSSVNFSYDTGWPGSIFPAKYIRNQFVFVFEHPLYPEYEFQGIVDIPDAPDRGFLNIAVEQKERRKVHECKTLSWWDMSIVNEYRTFKKSKLNLLKPMSWFLKNFNKWIRTKILDFPWKNWTWFECGQFWHQYFNKAMYYPAPNKFAAQILHEDTNNVELLDDGFSFRLKTDTTKEIRRIYGSNDFKENEDPFLYDAVKMENEKFGNGKKYKNSFNLKDSLFFVNRLFELYENENFREMTADLLNDLNKSIVVLKNNRDEDNSLDAVIEKGMILTKLPLLKLIEKK